MAVPNNYIDKIKKDGDSRMISPAADMVRVDNDNFEGTDLDEVLDEVAQAIGEAGEGGYAPPAGGIPKTDLASDVQNSLGKADTALQSFTETDPTVPSWAKQPTKPTYTAQEVGALPANTTIPTNTSDLTNDSGFVTSSTMTTALAGKQDTLTFDNAPTANSNNPVKSSGIKTALDAKADADDVPTKTEMADAIDDALGEAQVTVVPEGSVGIITSLGSDSNGDALAASMGKKLKIALLQIYSSLGNYAFPNGKPTLDLDGIVLYSVTKTIGTGLSATGDTSEVIMGYPLEVTIAITNNLYIIDDDSVVVTMGGSPVAGAWNAITKKVSIAAVTGNVVINVPSLTYVQDGLAFQLDGLNRGDTSGHWKDRIGNIDFTLNNCTENTDNVQFNGSSSYGEAASGVSVDVDATSATIECAYALSAALSVDSFCPMLKNGAGGKAGFCLMNSSEGSAIYAGGETAASAASTVCPILCANSSTAYMKGYASIKIKSSGTLTPEEGGYFNGSRTLQSSNGTGLGVGTTPMRIGRTSKNTYLNGKLYSIRIYSRKLTDAEILQNYAVDQKRFNIL